MQARRVVLLLALVAVCLWAASGTPVLAQGLARPVLVYIQPQVDNLYHAKGCSSLQAGASLITLPDARRQGYKPCDVCKPPR